MRYLLALITAVCSVLCCAQPSTSQGPSPASMEAADRFTVSLAAPSTPIYGGGDRLPRHFFDEYLPALFERTLSFPAAIPSGTTFRWIFTGPNGGLTLRFSNSKITLEQHYYNSYVLRANDPPRQRYPDQIWKESSADLSTSPHNITVRLHQLTVKILVDGRELLSQDCLLDLMRHQLAVDAPQDAHDTIAVAMERPVAKQTHITIDPEHIHQTILGFGGIMSFPAYHRMSASAQKAWFQMLAENNLLVQREYPIGVRLKQDLSNFTTLSDASPHYYGDNFPAGEMSDFNYTRQIRSMGGHVLYEYWAFPTWMSGPTKGSINAEEYARAIVGFCKQSVIHTGKPPDIVGIQNEVIQNGETWNAMVLELRKSLDAAGFRSVKIHMPDASNLVSGTRSAETLHENPQVWKDLDFSASHVYDYQKEFGNPDAMDPTISKWRSVTSDKPFLLTELAINSWQYQTMSNYQTAFAMAQLYQKSLTALDAKLLAYCWLLLDPEQPTFDQTRSLFVVDRANSFGFAPSGYTLRTFTAFSRRLPEGIRRIDATSDDPDLRVSAFSAPGLGQTLILLNQSTAPKQVTWSGLNSGFATLEVVDPYHANSIGSAAKLTTVTIPPGAIFTLSSAKLRSSTTVKPVH